MDASSWLPTDSTSGHFTQEEAREFYQDLREHYISFLVFPAVFCKNPNFPLRVGNVPPVMDLILAGDKIYDTEFKKDSHILKNKNMLYGSQQSLMSCLRSGELVMSELDTYSNEKMKELCLKLEFENLSR